MAPTFLLLVYSLTIFSLFQCLDEVQSYIVVERCLKDNKLGADSIIQESLHLVSKSFYLYSESL